MNDVTGDCLTEVGRRMRRGDYAYPAAAGAHRLEVRPPVTLHSAFLGPSMAEYHGGASAAVEGFEAYGQARGGASAATEEFMRLGYDF